ALGSAGAKLALISRNAEQLEAAAQEARQLGTAAEFFAADVTQEQQVQRVESDVLAKFGQVHILINNAGINIRKSVTDFTLADWNSVMDTNLTSAFLLCRAFVPLMKGHGYGRIL